MTLMLPQWPLFGLGDDSRPALRAALSAGEPAALATIVALSGGGPRPLGTQMVIAANALSGFLSGGCLEADVAGHARVVLAGGAPKRLVYGEGSPWPDIRLLCGARIEVQLERIERGDEAAERLFALGEARVPALWVSDGRRRACEPADRAPATWAGAYAKLFEPVPRLIVLGSDPTALAIATLGAHAGFETTLVRPKGPIEPPPIAAVAYSREEPAAALGKIGLDPWTAIAVATHDAELDHAALVAALPSSASYVGALGARRRVEDRRTWLRAAGVAEEHIDRLHAPIGLDIGGKAPWEVAIAVVAQITALRYDRGSASTSTGSPADTAGASRRRRTRALASEKIRTSDES
ncbi:MAG TPA: XdhC family protein [Caulobacteraceae bacterium]